MVGGGEAAAADLFFGFDEEAAAAVVGVAEGGELAEELGVVGDLDLALLEEFAEMPVGLGAAVGVEAFGVVGGRGVADVDAVDAEALFLEAVDDAGADADFVDAGLEGLVLADGVGDVAGELHGVDVGVGLDVDDGVAVAAEDDGVVGAEAGDVDAEGDGGVGVEFGYGLGVWGVGGFRVGCLAGDGALGFLGYARNDMGV